MGSNMKLKSTEMEEVIIPIKLHQPNGGGKHSKHNALCRTVHDSHENEK